MEKRLKYVWNMPLNEKIPIIKSLEDYNQGKFIQDLVAGITVAFTLIPQGLAYASLVGTPLVFGLYTASLPLFIYALFGSSRHIVYGPFAVTCFMLGDIGSRYVDLFPKGTEEYAEFILYLSFIAGILNWIALYLDLGSLVSMVTPSVTNGFITGCGILVFIHQIPFMFGFVLPSGLKHNTSVIGSIVEELNSSTGVALAISIPSLLFLLAMQKYKKYRNDNLTKIEKSEFQSRIKTLLLDMSFFIVFVCGFLVAERLLYKNKPAYDILFKVGKVPKGYQNPIFNTKNIPWKTAIGCIPQALTLTVVSSMSNWSICKKFSNKHNYKVNINQELFTQGLVNIIGSLGLNSFFNAGGLSRTAISTESGSKTQISNIIAATMIVIIVVYLNKPLEHLPMATLGSITAAGISGLIDFNPVFKAYNDGDKKEAAVMLTTTICTVILGVTQGIVLGVILSLFSEMYSNYFPRVVKLGIMDDNDNNADAGANKDMNKKLEFCLGGRTIPRITILRVDATSLYFGNADYIKNQIENHAINNMNFTHFLSNNNKRNKRSYIHVPKIETKIVIIDISSVRSIDETTVNLFVELKNSLHKNYNIVLAYIQGSSLNEQVIKSLNAPADSDIDTDTDVKNTTSTPTAAAANTSNEDGLRNRRESQVYKDSILASGDITSNLSDFNHGLHIKKQLEAAGATSMSIRKNPIITLFPSIEIAVKYFTFQIYLESIAANDESENPIPGKLVIPVAKAIESVVKGNDKEDTVQVATTITSTTGMTMQDNEMYADSSSSSSSTTTINNAEANNHAL